MQITTFQKMGRRDTLAALLLGLAATPATFAVVHLLTRSDHYMRILFFGRGPIQYLTTACFWITICALVIKHLRCRQERRAYEAARRILEDPEFGFRRNWTGAGEVRQRFVTDEHADLQDTQTFATIIGGLDRLRNAQSTAELDDYFRARAEMMAGELETSYAGIRYLIWLIPTLGFIGTVLGIGRGLAGFAQIIQTAESFNRVKEHLPTVTHALGTAFDTTLLALALSVFAVLYMSWMLKQEEHTLEKINMLCLDGVCALFEEDNRENRELIAALEKATSTLQTAMNGNRAELVNVIRERLPALLAGALGERFDHWGSTLESALDRLRGVLDERLAAEARRAESEENREALRALLVEIRDAVTRLAARFPDRPQAGDEA